MRDGTFTTLDPLSLDRLRIAFIDRMPGFGDFSEMGGSYWRNERAYKEELSSLCRSQLPRALFDDRGPSTSAADIVGAAKRVLTERLTNGNEPQNLVGWRYTTFLRRLSSEEEKTFAACVGNLLYGGGSSAERAEEFTRRTWPMYQKAGTRNPFAQARVFPTFFLMLMNPEDDIAVRTDMFESAAPQLIGRRVLRDAPFSAAEYDDVLALARAVQAQLEAWAWCPRDLIDVHSFLWVATRESYAGVAGAEVA